jgi:hypothetical protein
LNLQKAPHDAGAAGIRGGKECNKRERSLESRCKRKENKKREEQKERQVWMHKPEMGKRLKGREQRHACRLLVGRQAAAAGKHEPPSAKTCA